ncbi:MAG TPA: histidine phosphatase family protein [Paenirhodobacter sp.]
MRDETQIWLIRHAPARHEGRLAGRRDIMADPPTATTARALRGQVGAARIWASPARRCVATAQAIWPDQIPQTDPRLWEQDFGAWEGLPFAELPDLGPLPATDLAHHTPPGGESFATMCARVAAALQELPAGTHCLVAHAGTVRAALALAIGSVPGALAFAVEPLSITRITRLHGGWSVAGVNWRAA